MTETKETVNCKQVEDLGGEEQADKLAAFNVHGDVYEEAQKLAQAGADIEADTQAERALVRKIDWRLMPIMCFTYALQYYDKALLSQAAIFGMRDELDLSDHPLRYSNVSMIFYVGYIVGCYPISYLAQRYPTARVCAGTCFVWAIIVLSTAGCKSYGSLLTNRFFLGLVESGVAPSFMLVTSMWYTHGEQLTRSGFWYCCSGGANLISPLINYGVGSITGGSLSSWQYMYLVAGCATLLWSFVIYFLLPSSPITAPGFTKLEKAMILKRIQANNNGTLNRKFKPKHVLECATSLNFWCVNLMACLTSITSGPVSSFGSIIFHGMGFNKFESLLMNIPIGALAIICINSSAYAGRRFRDARLYIIATASPLVVLGCALVWQLPSSNRAGRIAGFYILNFFSSAYVQCIGLGTSNVSGYTKKATSAAGIFVSYCVGNIVGPLMFSEDDAPRYDPGFMGTLICLAACVVTALVLRLHLARENKKRDRLYGPAGMAHGLDDLTDRENKDFRYCL